MNWDKGIEIEPFLSNLSNQCKFSVMNEFILNLHN